MTHNNSINSEISNKIKQEINNEKNSILSFWTNMVDSENGGFYCKMTSDLILDKKAPKSAIAMTRNLWTFSKSYNADKDKNHLEIAEQAYKFITEHMIDEQYKGIYWMTDYSGKVIDDRKHIYLQAFGIYAFSEYYKASKDEIALKMAMELYDIIENIGYDKVYEGYKEEFNRDWSDKSNEMLSENEITAQITMNTHLHILEAYTNLYLVNSDAKVGESLQKLLDIFYTKIYSHEKMCNKVFFDDKWNEMINLQSYGHDIEASWLIDDAINALKISDGKYDKMVMDTAKNILDNAILDDGSIANECEDNIIDYTKVWWVQAEAAVGFLNAYNKSGDIDFFNAFKNVLKYIYEYVVDNRKDSEWYAGRDKNNIPLKDDIAEGWKAAYHNGRFCFEILKRI